MYAADQYDAFITEKRGGKLVRFRGRYFLFEFCDDGDPKGLGRQLVDQIPSDPVKYRS